MKIAVIGAGLSGANIYRLLKEQNHEVSIFDKSRGAGGRCSTRYIEEKKIDHGTPFFEVNNIDFIEFCENLVKENILNKKENEYYPVNGMNQICSYCIDKNDFYTQTKIMQATYMNQKWNLLDEKGKYYGNFDRLIITIPAPQILQIDMQLNKDIIEKLQSVEYDSIASLMVYAYTIQNLDNPKLIQDVMFKKIVNNSKKYDYDNFSSYVLHLNPTLSNHHNFSTKDEVREFMLNKIYTLTGENLEDDFHVVPHLWRYAFVTQRIETEYVYDQNCGLGICGDFFKYKDLEGAFLSSQKLFENGNFSSFI